MVGVVDVANSYPEGRSVPTSLPAFIGSEKLGTYSSKHPRLTCLLGRPVPSTPEVHRAEGQPLHSEGRVVVLLGSRAGPVVVVVVAVVEVVVASSD